MTKNQKLDVLGVLLSFSGLLLLLALFSPNNSPIVNTIVSYLYLIFGIGRYIVAVSLTIIGMLITLRHFNENLPEIEPEQFVGILLLFIAIITTLSVLINSTIGGMLGSYIANTMMRGLGTIGTIIALIAWIAIGTIFAFKTSVETIINLFTSLSIEPQYIPKFARTKNNKVKNSSKQDTKKDEISIDHMQSIQSKDTDQSHTEDLHNEIDEQLLQTNSNVNNESQKWVLPKTASILALGTELTADDEYDRERAQIIEETLLSFGAPGRVIEINRGPTITQFGVEPDFVSNRSGKRTKVKVNKISALADDLALALAAASIRIEAPVPGKGYIGMEVPNSTSSQVALRDLIESKAYKSIKSPLALCLGQDVSGAPICADLRSMPHLLIAGTTGSGKSVCVNGIIATLLLNNSPDTLKMLMIDPKRVELTTYRHIPHLLVPVIVDVNKVVSSLQWISREMDNRYSKFSNIGARNIEDFNKKAFKHDEEKLPYIVVIVDELADLMMASAEDTEQIITRLAQMARATGIHLIISTQRPSSDVVTGLIKANFPARIAFAVASLIDSRVILDHPGAERLLGRGDMLFQAPDAAQPLRMQGTYVSDTELRKLVRHWRDLNKNSINTTNEQISEKDENNSDDDTHENQEAQNLSEEIENLAKVEERDELYDKAIMIIQQQDRASISMLQRHLRIGYTRAAKLIDDLEENGIIGPAKSGAKQRDVLFKSSDSTDLSDRFDETIEPIPDNKNP